MGKNPGKTTSTSLRLGPTWLHHFTAAKDIHPLDPLLQDRAKRCALDVADVVTEAGLPGVGEDGTRPKPRMFPKGYEFAVDFLWFLDGGNSNIFYFHLYSLTYLGFHDPI